MDGNQIDLDLVVPLSKKIINSIENYSQIFLQKLVKEKLASGY